MREGWYRGIMVPDLNPDLIRLLRELDAGFVTSMPPIMSMELILDPGFPIMFHDWINTNRPLLIRTLMEEMEDWDNARTILQDRCADRHVRVGEDITMPDGSVLYRWGTEPWVVLGPSGPYCEVLADVIHRGYNHRTVESWEDVPGIYKTGKGVLVHVYRSEGMVHVRPLDGKRELEMSERGHTVSDLWDLMTGRGLDPWFIAFREGDEGGRLLLEVMDN